MSGIDTWLEQWLHGSATLSLVLIVSLALGLRHAADPDHLAAVTALIATGHGKRSTQQAGLMGLSWGIGHATTLLLLGLPILLFNRYLPEIVQRGLEIVIGTLIISLALRLLIRWRHSHGHLHETPNRGRHGAHSAWLPQWHTSGSLRRTPFGAYAIGLLHGAGGTAGLTLLLLARIPDRAAAIWALLLFAVGTALSMALLSSGFGWIITTGPIARKFDRITRLLGLASFFFGVGYLWNALS